MNRIQRIGTAVAICLAVAPAAMSQGWKDGEYKAYKPNVDALLKAKVMIDCHATFFRTGTSYSYTPDPWKVAIPALNMDDDDAKMDACKASATALWLDTGKILHFLNYSSTQQDQICRAGKVTVRTDYGWQQTWSRGKQPSFIHQVSSPDCSCTCLTKNNLYLATSKKCATVFAQASGINDGPLGGDFVGVGGTIWKLNTSPYSCKFK